MDSQGERSEAELAAQMQLVAATGQPALLAWYQGLTPSERGRLDGYVQRLLARVQPALDATVAMLQGFFEALRQAVDAAMRRYDLVRSTEWRRERWALRAGLRFGWDGAEVCREYWPPIRGYGVSLN